MDKLNIVRPRFPDLALIHSEFDDVLTSGIVTNNGPWVQKFEARLSEIIGVPTLAFNNGMTALMTMLRAVGVSTTEVVCPSFTFAATPAAVEWSGGDPVFADIDPKTLTLDP